MIDTVAGKTDSRKGDGRMKFLTINTEKDILYALPPARTLQILESSYAWAQEQKKAGRRRESWGVPGWKRVVAIMEAESSEALARVYFDHPIAQFMDFEVYPLSDYDTYWKDKIEMVRKTEQMFRSPAAAK